MAAAAWVPAEAPMPAALAPAEAPAEAPEEAPTPAPEALRAEALAAGRSPVAAERFAGRC